MLDNLMAAIPLCYITSIDKYIDFPSSTTTYRTNIRLGLMFVL